MWCILLSQAARDGFCSKVKKLMAVERETRIATNRRVDLGRATPYIVVEDDSLISHSSVLLLIDAFLERLYDLSMGYRSHFGSSFQSSPKNFHNYGCVLVYKQGQCSDNSLCAKIHLSFSLFPKFLPDDRYVENIWRFISLQMFIAPQIPS